MKNIELYCEDQDLFLRTSENIRYVITYIFDTFLFFYIYLLYIYCSTQVYWLINIAYIISDTEWAVPLWCYMMYVMLSPYLLHEIGSENTSLMGSNLIAGDKSQLYFVCTMCVKWRTCYAVRRRLFAFTSFAEKRQESLPEPVLFSKCKQNANYLSRGNTG
jgi:hypothetical protein